MNKDRGKIDERKDRQRKDRGKTKKTEERQER